MRVGRNDPCPCGSGLKYKKCCLGQGEKTLQEVLNKSSCDTIEAAEGIAQRQVALRNQRPIDDFSGLSPEQMHALLYHPFESPQIVTFNESISHPALNQAPILTLLTPLIEAMPEEGLKATAKGNLPLKLCKEIADHYWRADREWHPRLSSEVDFDPLHTLRLLLKQAGLIRKRKGRFLLTQRCKTILQKQGIQGLYLPLFNSYTTRFNWAYRDRMDEIPTIQHTFLFTLYLLQQYGEEWREDRFYTERFLRAFPMAQEEIQSGSNYFTAEESLHHAYSHRALTQFARYFGLIEIDNRGGKITKREHHIRKTPLLFELLHFQGDMGEVH